MNSKLKLQKNDINPKRYTRLKFKHRLQSMKTQKNEQIQNKARKT